MARIIHKLAALALGAVGFIGAQAEGGNVKLYALDCGTVEMLDLAVFSQEGMYVGEKNTAADPCFLISHPKGNFLWDTGLNEGLADMPEGIVSGAFHLKVTAKLTDQLAQIDIKPEDIDYLSISHSHFDHLGNGGKFASATFIIHEKEREHMFSDQAKANEVVYAAYGALENSKTIEFTEEHDVFGDGTAVIKALVGHTPGHSVLMLNLDNAGPVYLTGDLYHFTRARQNRTVPTFNTNADDTRASMEIFEKLVAESGARVVIQHEKADFDKLPKFPAYLD